MALNGTMVKIQTVTVGSGGAASIDFTSIPQTYTDLVIKISARSNDTSTFGDAILVQFNGATTNLSSRRLYGTGAGAASVSGTTAYAGQASSSTQTANTFGNSELYIPNYTSSTNKSSSSDGVNENNAANAITQFSANLWSSTAAITSVLLKPEVGTAFTQHSTATLYGISRTTAQIKATGGMVYDDANFVYHLFTSSGTFTPTQALTADVLVIAGGGGGGDGGGGAGGLLDYTSESLTAQSYTITIGAGGTGGRNANSNATAGSNSQFGSLTASVGGGRGGTPNVAGGSSTGGSGGGSHTNDAGSAGTSGQGTSGGTGYTDNASYSLGGGGGGKGVAGGNAAILSSGSGGNGSSAYSSWGSATSTGQNISGTYWYAGGGAGGGGKAGQTISLGAAGNGGGGAGVFTPNGFSSTQNATANTGGGGGGGTGTTFFAGAGGSGLVIVRYAK